MADITTAVAVSVADGSGNLSVNESTPNGAGALSTAEAIAYSLILPTLIAATVFGNVLVVLSVFTYAVYRIPKKDGVTVYETVSHSLKCHHTTW